MADQNHSIKDSDRSEALDGESLRDLEAAIKGIVTTSKPIDPD
jgi:hypothetical protein